jgi:hypothetical protein
VGVSASVAADPSSLSVSDPLVTEGDTGSKDAVFTVSLSAPSDQPVTVGYATADESAKERVDYVPNAGTLTFAPGETAKTVAVAVLGDTMDEFNESFSLGLSNPAGATLAETRGTGTILDNDPRPSVSASDLRVDEAAGEAVFQLSLSAESGKELAVSFATADGTATAPGDYAAASGRVWFFPGEMSKTVRVALVGDSLLESDETFFLNLSGTINVSLADAQAVATITDDNAPPPPEDPPTPPEDPPTPPEDPPAPPEDPPAAPEDPPTEPANAAPDCSNVASSNTWLWPPNGKFRLVWLSGASDPDGDAVGLDVLGVTQDEPTARNGRGDRGPDAAWVPGHPNQVRLRAQRKGWGDGRVYHVAFRASDGNGGSCSGTVQVTVPHDWGRPARDSGFAYDSFGS